MRLPASSLQRLTALAILLALAQGSVAADPPAVQSKNARVRIRASQLEVKSDFKVTLEATGEAGARLPESVVDERTVKVLKNGQFLEVAVTSEKAGYLRIFYQGSNGDISQLFPNAHAKNDVIQANVRVVVGSAKDPFGLAIEPPLGAECLGVIVSTVPFADDASATKSAKEEIFQTVRGENVGDAIAKAAVKPRPGAPAKPSLTGAALLHLETTH